MLPFRLPVRSTTYMIIDDIVFVFLQRAYDKHYAGSDVGFTGGRIKHTIVEATQAITEKKHQNIYRYLRKKPNVSDKHHSEVFDKQFKILNNFCETILVSMNFYNIDELTLHNIVGVPYYRLYEEEEGKTKTNSEGPFFINNTNVYNDMNEFHMNYSELNNVINNYKYIRQNPYFQFELYLQRGYKAFKEEDFNQTIILYQTALEIFVKRIIIDYYKITKIKSKQEISNLENDTKFKNHINHHFYCMLNKLNFKNQESITKIIDIYLAEPVVRRHNIVHEGKYYGREEAYENSLLIKDIFRLFIFDIHQVEIDDLQTGKIKFIKYFKELYSEIPDINDIIARYKIKIL